MKYFIRLLKPDVVQIWAETEYKTWEERYSKKPGLWCEVDIPSSKKYGTQAQEISETKYQALKRLYAANW